MAGKIGGNSDVKKEIEQEIKEANAKLNQLDLLYKEMNKNEEADAHQINIVMKCIPVKEVYCYYSQSLTT